MALAEPLPSEIASAIEAFPKPERTVAPMPLSVRDFLGLELPARACLLEPWLPEKGLAMIVAPRGLGKTHLALGVSWAVATGSTFLKWAAPTPRRVLYIDGEMPAAALQERVARITRDATGEPEEGYLDLLLADLAEQGLPDLSTREGQEALHPRLEPYDLIVLDNLSTLCRTGRENEAESWAQVQSFLLSLRRAGKSALLVHHTGKGGQQRGTSKKEDVLDSVLLLKRPDNYDPQEGARFTATFDKARGFAGAEAEPFEAALDPRTGLWRVQAATNDRDDQIVALAAEGVSQRGIAKELGTSLGTVNRVLQRHREDKPDVR